MALLRACPHDAGWLAGTTCPVLPRLLPFLAISAHTYVDYVGCMKTGPVIKSNQYRWYEPQHALIGAEYFAHAWGEHRGRCCCRPTAHVPASGLVGLQDIARCIMQHLATWLCLSGLHRASLPPCMSPSIHATASPSTQHRQHLRAERACGS